jgi:hypothetical protein
MHDEQSLHCCHSFVQCGSSSLNQKVEI